ncbi:MAG: HEAT repeat domain-containing protein [Spirochaetota bacterium]
MSFCSIDTTKYDALTFEDNPIHALHHPLPDTVSIAITVLGTIQSRKAVKPLKELFNKTFDPYIQKAILDALFAIRTKESIRFVKTMLTHINVIVRKEAEMLVKKLQQMSIQGDSF